MSGVSEHPVLQLTGRSCRWQPAASASPRKRTLVPHRVYYMRLCLSVSSDPIDADLLCLGVGTESKRAIPADLTDVGRKQLGMQPCSGALW